MDGKRTLCKRCVGDYRIAGFYAFLDGYQVIKKSCDLCGRPGFDYITGKAEKRRANEKSGIYWRGIRQGK